VDCSSDECTSDLKTNTISVSHVNGVTRTGVGDGDATVPGKICTADAGTGDAVNMAYANCIGFDRVQLWPHSSPENWPCCFGRSTYCFPLRILLWRLWRLRQQPAGFRDAIRANA